MVRFAVVLVLVLALAVVACGDGSSDERRTTPRATASPEREGPNALLADGRTELLICVDGVAAYEPTEDDIERLAAAVDDALSDSIIPVPAEYSDPRIVDGCPLRPAPVIGAGSYLDITAHHSIVTEPSPYRLFIYLAPGDAYRDDPLLTRHHVRYVLSNAEITCRVDACVGVSRAIYLPSDARAELMDEAILAGLRLLPYTPEPEPTFDLAGCESGVPDIPACHEYLLCKTPREHDNCEERLSDLGLGPGTPSP